MAGRVLTLTGPSGSGKSTVVQQLIASANDVFKPVLVSKETTRAPRTDDGPEVETVSAISADCDLVYEQYGVRYGFRAARLMEFLADGKSPIVIVNDVRTVADLRRSLGPRVRSAYVFRSAPSLEGLMRLAAERGAELDEYQGRYQKAQAIHRVYIENIELFDRVILNVQSRTRTRQQVRAIVRADWPKRVASFK